MAAVAVLIAIAIAGLVLGWHGPSRDSVSAAPVPNSVSFAVASDKLSEEARATIARFAEAARRGGQVARLTARYRTGDGRLRDLALAKSRIAAVYHGIVDIGLAPDHIEMQLVEMPAEGFDAADANRIGLTLH